jgi:antitoxin (DNA-binding transcriptional repressor) of toxin-antitoxin stability system
MSFETDAARLQGLLNSLRMSNGSRMQIRIAAVALSLVKNNDLPAKLALRQAEQIAQEERDSQDIDEHREQMEQRWKRFFASAGLMFDTAAKVATASTRISLSAYTSDRLFTRNIGLLDVFGTAVRGLSQAIISAASGFFGLGAGVAGVARAGQVVAEITLSVARMELEMAEQFVGYVKTISQSGATFGGDLVLMTQSAHAAGLNLATYAEYLKTNAAMLTNFGGSLAQGTRMIAGMTRDMLDKNPKLLFVFGGFGEAMTAVTQASDFVFRSGANRDIRGQEINSRSQMLAKNLLAIQQATGQNAESVLRDTEEMQMNLAVRERMADLRARGISSGLVDAMIPMFAALGRRYSASQGSMTQILMYILGTPGGRPVDPRIVDLITRTPGLRDAAELVRTLMNQVEQGQITTEQEMAQRMGMIFNQFSEQALKYNGLYTQAGIREAEAINEPGRLLATAVQNLEWSRGFGQNWKTITAEFASRTQADTALLYQDYMKQLEQKIKQDNTNMIKFSNGTYAQMARDMDTLIINLTERFGSLGGLTDRFVSGLDRLIQVANESGDPDGPYQPGSGLEEFFKWAFGTRPKDTDVDAGPGKPGTTPGARAGTTFQRRLGSTAIGTNTTMDKIKAVIDRAEGGGSYNIIYGNNPVARFVPAWRDRQLTDLTIREVYQLQEAMSPIVHTQAVGRFQFMRGTLKSLVKRAGIKPTAKFSGTLQDQLGELLIQDAGFPEIKDKGLLLPSLANIWRGLPNRPGMRRGEPTDNTGMNRAQLSWDEAIAMMDKGGSVQSVALVGERGMEIVDTADGNITGELEAITQELSRIGQALERRADLLNTMGLALERAV